MLLLLSSSAPGAGRVVTVDCHYFIDYQLYVVTFHKQKVYVSLIARHICVSHGVIHEYNRRYQVNHRSTQAAIFNSYNTVALPPTS